jgi:hypothetical protein
MIKEELYLELLKNNNLEALKEELEKTIISKCKYANTIKQYFKKIDKKASRYLEAYHEFDNNTYITDGFSFFKVIDTAKLYKVTNIKSNAIDKILEETLKTDISDFAIIDVDLLNVNLEKYNCEDLEVYRFEDTYINSYYFKIAYKLLNTKNVRICTSKNHAYGFTYILDSENNIIAGIMPVRTNKEMLIRVA